MIKTFGRGDDNDIVFDKPDISRHHVKITSINSNSFLVEDLGSVNGTFVNGHRIEKKATISSSEELRLSESTIINILEII